MNLKNLLYTVFIAIAIIVTLAQPYPASAAPNGKLYTAETVAAGAIIYELLHLAVDAHKTAGSVRAANDVFLATPADGDSLANERAKVIYAVAKSVALTNTDPNLKFQRTRLRLYYEDLRSCWNTAFSDPAPVSSPKPPEKASAAPTDATGSAAGGAHKLIGTSGDRAATPQATPKPPSCDALATNDGYEPPDTIDAIDLAVSLKSAPSLFQEVLDQRVGSYDNNNLIRAQYLQGVAADFVTRTAVLAPTPSPMLGILSFGTGSDLFAKCFSKLVASPIDCATELETLEVAAASALSHRKACDWSRHAWLPMFSAVKTVWASPRAPTSPPTDARTIRVINDTDFGAAPSC
jgi:hypothetical protein